MWRNVDVFVLSPLVSVVLRTEKGLCKLTGNEISLGLTLAVFRETKSYFTSEGLPSFKRKYDCLVKKIEFRQRPLIRFTALFCRNAEHNVKTALQSYIASSSFPSI